MLDVEDFLKIGILFIALFISIFPFIIVLMLLGLNDIQIISICIIEMMWIYFLKYFIKCFEG